MPHSWPAHGFVQGTQLLPSQAEPLPQVPHDTVVPQLLTAVPQVLAPHDTAGLSGAQTQRPVPSQDSLMGQLPQETSTPQVSFWVPQLRPPQGLPQLEHAPASLHTVPLGQPPPLGPHAKLCPQALRLPHTRAAQGLQLSQSPLPPQRCPPGQLSVCATFPETGSQVSFVQLFPSLALTGVCAGPDDGSQASTVQALPSSTEMAPPPTHLPPPSHVLAAAQGEPGTQGAPAATFVWLHALATHVSSVQGFWSLQAASPVQPSHPATSAWVTPVGSLHASTVHGLPSSRTTGVWLTPAFGSQASTVQTEPSAKAIGA